MKKRAILLLALCTTLTSAFPFNVQAEESNDTFVVIPYMQTESFDPYTSDMDNIVTVQLYDYLFQRDGDGNVIPCLAESWEESDDEMSVTVKLRQDVTFSDGTAFNADAVAFSFGLTADSYYQQVNGIKNIEKIDDYTVKIEKYAVYTKVENVLVEQMPIVCPSAYEAGQQDFSQNPIGTGAYTLESYDASTGYIYLKSREDYFQGSPAIKNIEIQVPMDSSVSLIAMENKEADLAELPLSASDRELAKESGLIVEQSSGWSMKTVFLTGEPYKSDKNLRLAICFAINRENVAIFNGDDAEPATDMFAEKLMGAYAGKTELYGYDPEKAKEYLEKSDYNGEPLDINVTEEASDIATSIQADLQAIGIQTNINLLDANTFGSLFEKGDVQLTILDNGVASYGIEDTLSNFCNNGYYIESGMFSSTPELDTLMQSIVDSSTKEECMEEMAELLPLFQDNCSIIPLYETPLTYTHTDDLEGAEPIWGATTFMYLWKCQMK